MKLLLFLAALSGGAASGLAEPVLWRLDRVDGIGGQRTEVLGAPRVAAEGGVPAIHFNGASDGLLLAANPLAGQAVFTIEALIKPDIEGPFEQRFLHVEDKTGARTLLELRLEQGTWALDGFVFSPATRGRLVLYDPAKRHPAGRWAWVALVYGNGRLSTYINGVKELEEPVAFPPFGPGRVSLGVRQNKVSWFKGGMREVRWHAAALAPAELQRPPAE